MAMYEPDGTPWFADPRHVLNRVLERFARKGLTPVCAFELEFYLLKPDFETDAMASPLPHIGHLTGPERQQMYSINTLSRLEEFFADITNAARAQDLPMDTVISEAGPGQFEINLLHRADAALAADEALLLRRMIGGVARRHGHRASFMSKPFQHWPGNGMHVHVSLQDESGRNLFADGARGEKMLRHAVAGTLATMPDMLAVFVNTFNGYRPAGAGQLRAHPRRLGREQPFGRRAHSFRQPRGTAAGTSHLRRRRPPAPGRRGAAGGDAGGHREGNGAAGAGPPPMPTRATAKARS